MAEELSQELDYRLKAGLATWRDWVSGPEKLPVVVRRLGGLSNVSFLVSDQKRCWAFRLNHPSGAEGIDLGADPASELSAMMVAANEGLAPPVAFSSSEILVSEYVVGDKPSLADLQQIGELFRRVHQLEADVRTIDLHQHLINYHRQVRKDSAIDACFERVMALGVPAGESVVCHQDLLFENMILTTTGIVAVDWEYARMADPAYDLAVFTASYSVNVQQRNILFNAYQSSDTGLPERIAYFEKVYWLIEILWWRLKGRRMGDKINRLTRSLVLS